MSALFNDDDMPIYEYLTTDPDHACPHCREPFEVIQKIADPKLTACPRCGRAVARQISAAAVGHSRSSLDDRAKAAGFTKFKKLGKGEYERQYG